MAPDFDLEGKSDTTMEVLINKDNGNAPNGSGDKPMSCASNFEDNTFHVEAALGESSLASNRSEDVEVNITEFKNSSGSGLVEADNQDATESSSSFGDTLSGIEDLSSDAEAESRFCGGNTPASLFNGCTKIGRKKKVRPQWRQFIGPLMWRCKWLELQMKEIQSQAFKYDRQLAICDRRQQFQTENFALEGLSVKSLPFPSEIRRREIMKRKKRRRMEDTVDMTSYMSHHNLFSYYENSKSIADSGLDNDYRNKDKIMNGDNDFGVNEDWSFLELKEGDDSLEQILWTIDKMKLQVEKLITRVDKVLTESPRKFASVNKLSSPGSCDAMTSSAQNRVSSSCNRDKTAVQKLFRSESTVSSHGGASALPNIIDSTDQIEKEIMDNQGELHCSKKAKLELVKRSHVEQESSIPSVRISGVEIRAQSSGKSLPKCYIPKNKRKQGRRKAGLGRWSRRSSG